MTSIPLAIQLWTLRHECERDFFGALAEIARVGYRWIEPYDFHGVDPSALADRLRALDLKVISSHVPLDRLEIDLDRVIQEHEILGCRNIVCPWLPEERRQGARAFETIGGILEGIGLRLRERGFTLAYHNHDFEFTMARDPDGLARILAHADPKNLTSQLDVFWISFAGLDPVRYAERLGSRLSSIHLKDGFPGEERFTPLGRGTIDIPPLVELGRRLGVRSFVVEQDECEDEPIAAVAESLNYLRGLGLDG